MSRQPKMMKKAVIIAENEQLLKEVKASRQLHESIIQELQQEIDLLNRQVIHYKDDVVALRNGIRELNKLANEIDEWASKIIYKHINGGNNDGLT